MAIVVVQVVGKFYTPGGVAVDTGLIICRLSQSASAADGASSARVVGETIGTIVAGVVTGLSLAADDAMTPTGTVYTVRFDSLMAGGKMLRVPAETWQIASTPNPIDVGAVPRLNVIPGVAVSVSADVAASAAAAAASLAAGIAATSATLVTATGSTTPRTLGARAGDLIYLEDNGCVLDGATNNYAALSALVTRLGSTAKTIVVTGPCKSNSAITLPSTLQIRFEGNGLFVGAVNYSGMAIIPANVSNPGTQYAPFLWNTLTPGRGDPDYLYDDVWNFNYNRDPANSAAAFSAFQPQWTEQLESRYSWGSAPRHTVFEKHWNYTSIDRGTTYRPMNFSVDLDTHRASMQWLLETWEVFNRVNSGDAAVKITSTPGAENVTIRTTGSAPFNAYGSDGSAYLSLGVYPEFVGANAAATAGTTMTPGFGFRSRGYRWSGGVSVAADAVFGAIIRGTTANDVGAFMRAPNGKQLNLMNTGAVEVSNDEFLRMQSPDGNWWKVTVANGGTLSIVAN